MFLLSQLLWFYPSGVLLRGRGLEHPESRMPFRPSCVMSQQLSVLQEVHRDFSETYQNTRCLILRGKSVSVVGGVCVGQVVHATNSGMEWERSSSVANSTGRNGFCTWILLPLHLYYFSTRREHFPSAPARATTWAVRSHYSSSSQVTLWTVFLKAFWASSFPL